MKKNLIRAALLVAVFLPGQLFAWGGLGHRTVVAIAERHLTQKAKKNIAAYMPYSLTREATYMDSHRRDSNLLYAYYFHEQCIDLKTLEYDPNNHVECGDIMRALWLADYNLSHYTQVSDSIVMLNLRMLLHFVGENHCPVHLGIPIAWRPKPPFRLDKGKWFYKGKAYGSYHGFFDIVPTIMFPGMDEFQVAEAIDKVSAKQARKWVKGDFVVWTNDAARSGFRIYDYGVPPIWDIPDTPEPKYIPDSHVDDIAPIVTEEILKAGYQLAFLLNKYFDK